MPDSIWLVAEFSLCNILTNAIFLIVSRGSISPCEFYLTWVSTGGVVSTSPNPQAGGTRHVGCMRLLIQFICSYPPYQRPFLHPQPQYAPCRGDRDPLITWIAKLLLQNILQYYTSINGCDLQKVSSLQGCNPNFKRYMAQSKK